MLELGQTKVVVMDGKSGEVQRVSERSYIITVGEHTKQVLLPAEVWHDGCEYTPSEVAFGLMLDYMKLNDLR